MKCKLTKLNKRSLFSLIDAEWVESFIRITNTRLVNKKLQDYIFALLLMVGKYKIIKFRNLPIRIIYSILFPKF